MTLLSQSGAAIATLRYSEFGANLKLVLQLMALVAGISSCSGQPTGASGPTELGAPARMQIVPASAVLDPSQVQDFTVRVMDSLGQPLSPVAIRWTATGGTVDNAGQYRAGSAAGRFEVVATETGTGLADTVPVAVGMGLLESHEPTDFTVLSDRPFNAPVESGWQDRGDAHFSIVPDVTAPHSPVMVGQALFSKGFVGGGGPINTYLPVDADKVRDLYLGIWFKVSNNFVGAPSNGINKVLHIWIGGTTKVVLAVMGRNLEALMPTLRLQGISADRRGVSFNLDPSNSSLRITRGKWCFLEVLLRANTPGKSDGQATWWLDGQLVGSYMDIGYEADGESPYWETVSWNPTWGAPADIAPAGMEMWIDHFRVSGR